ncbi:hypothetical protein Vadar_010856 [Vaccinium darrowii]|uniref:Uncharacterized protein n=1 Tax=Vaccinium darrowii TaxID=229202 RepID=A0ACB7X9J8_9ERIC|nr:hypothetical protein Vadar_010856 [Vaccinium darrowii]
MFPHLSPRRMTPPPPFTLFFQRRAIPLPSSLLCPLSSPVALPSLSPQNPRPRPFPFPQPPSSPPSNMIWTKKFVGKLSVTHLTVISVEVLIGKRSRRKFAEEQERRFSASKLALNERHEEIVSELCKLVTTEDEKKNERKSARKALDEQESKGSEKGKIVKEESASNAPTLVADDLVISSRQSYPRAYRLYMELLTRHAFSFVSQIKCPNYEKALKTSV